ncbi:MAG: PmoA family protein [Candidatus Poribacteria bacterium]|nr:PmoA family protein [Candidatus Poribacteria bacterium]
MAKQNCLTLTVNAGFHDRDGCPIVIDVDHPDISKFTNRDVILTDTESGEEISAQCITNADGDAISLAWILDGLSAGATRTYTLSEGTVDKTGVQLREDSDTIDITLNGREFTTFRYGKTQYRPYFFPVLGPNGREVTRGETSDISKDHVHHRSLYVAYGEVNDIDLWGEGSNCGKVIHQGFTQKHGGSVVGRIYTENNWETKDGEVLMTDKQNFRIYNLPEDRTIIELDLSFIASTRDVHFGDTKEGGIMCIRVNPSMNASDGGKIENAFGGINEGETWGKRANWCDYSGIVEGTPVGIVVYDHIVNPRYPTYWHVRNYGLMGSNIFGSGTFERDKSKDGSYILKEGGEMHFRFRVLIHAGDATEGKVAQKYHDFINPPTVEISQE